MTRTLDELERMAYITGDTVTADLLGQVIDYGPDAVEKLRDEIEDLQDELEQLKDQS